MRLDWLLIDVIQWGAANPWSLAVVGLVVMAMLVLAGTLLVVGLTR